jgi:Uma2 family endonuclease
VQNPVRLSDLTEPQPDLALLRRRDDFYAARHPLPPDTLLVVEVSHTTLGLDRGIKLPLYATAGIPEVWIVNPEDDVVEVCRDPAKGRYRREERLGRTGALRCLAVPGLEIPVDQVLG